MWMPAALGVPQSSSDADLLESASVAHLYGRRFVAAESFSAVGLPGVAYAFAPRDLKATADREFADGVTRVVIHSSVHQPLERGPGITLGPYGQWFTRKETWAESAAPWISYLARSSALLTQGQFVADVLYFYGQDSNITSLYSDHLPPVPEGYRFDFANVDALKTLSVTNGALVSDSDMHYRVLALDPRARVMSLDVLREIARLVGAGATVIGHAPVTTPSLADSDSDFRALSRALWGPAALPMHRFGKGLVLHESLSRALSTLGIAPDIQGWGGLRSSEIRFVHRHLSGGDVYFITNGSDRPKHGDVSFRLSGRVPQLWHADTGKIESVSFRQEAGRTIVPLDLAADDAVFVVFRNPASTPERAFPATIRQRAATVSGPWGVRFKFPDGTSRATTFETLHSWSTSPDPAIRYFSGSAHYTQQFVIPPERLATRTRLELDLGAVQSIARVSLNGCDLGTLWHAPFRVDATPCIQAGTNHLEIELSNLWVNRLIGDRQPKAEPVAFTTFNPYSADSPLPTSGLLGPVTLERVSIEPAPRLSKADREFLHELHARLTQWRIQASPGSGPYPAMRAEYSSLPTHTVYRPTNLEAFSGKLPIIAFANGGCRNTSVEYTALLGEIASHGYLIVAVGRNDIDYATTDLNESARSSNGQPVEILDPAILKRGVDWAIEQNALPRGPLADKIDTGHIAYMGQSCGGVQALTASTDPRTTTTMVLNSAYFDASNYQGDLSGLPPRVSWSQLHAPIAFLIGGPTDIAYHAARDNFAAIRTLPVWEGNLPVGHLGGHYPRVDLRWLKAIVGWLDWQMKGSPSARALFVGPHALGRAQGWTVESRDLN